MISRQDLLSIMITFSVGVVAGMYIYVVGFVPRVEQFQDYIEPPEQALAIVGEQYGGFRGGEAPSFQITADNTYRFIAPAPFGVVVEPVQGELDVAWRRPLRPYLNADTLTAAAAPRSGDCASFVDGIDYRYRITLDGLVYELDTCTTALLDNAPLAAALANLWNYFVVAE